MTEPGGRRGRPNIVGIEKGIGPLEAQILRALHELGCPASVRGLCDQLARDGYFAYQGVLNCSNRLVQKGLLEREERRGAYFYRALVDPETLTAQVMEDVLTHLGAEPSRVVCRLLHIDPDVGAPEIAKLRARLQTAPKKRKP